MSPDEAKKGVVHGYEGVWIPGREKVRVQVLGGIEEDLVISYVISDVNNVIAYLKSLK